MKLLLTLFVIFALNSAVYADLITKSIKSHSDIDTKITEVKKNGYNELLITYLNSIDEISAQQKNAALDTYLKRMKYYIDISANKKIKKKKY